MKTYLTSEIIRDLVVSEKPIIVSDEGCQNLVLVVRPTGSKTWQWRGRFRGQKAQHTLGNYPAHGIASARKWSNGITAARDIDVDVIAKRPISPARAKRQPSVVARPLEVNRTRTCDWLWSVYLDAGTRELKTSTLQEKKRVYARDIKPHIGTKIVDSITYYDLAELVADKHRTAPIGSNGMVAIIKKWFHWAVTSGRPLTRLENDPARDLMKMEAARSRDRFLSDYELRLLFRVLNKTESVMREPITLILYTGVRRAEAFGARWSEFEHNDKGQWVIPGKRTKNGAVHLIPLPSVMQAMMKEIRERSEGRELVWPTSRCAPDKMERPMSGYSHFMERLNEQMRELAKRDGRTLRKFAIHDLRRTMTTGMRALHDDDDNALIQGNIVERCVNHAIVGVAAVYDRHDYLREKKAAFRIWAEHLNQLRDQALSSEQY